MLGTHETGYEIAGLTAPLTLAAHEFDVYQRDSASELVVHPLAAAGICAGGECVAFCWLCCLLGTDML